MRNELPFFPPVSCLVSQAARAQGAQWNTLLSCIVVKYHLTCITFKDSEIMQSASHNISQLRQGLKRA